jgi:hypothetical protein
VFGRTSTQTIEQRLGRQLTTPCCSLPQSPPWGHTVICSVHCVCTLVMKIVNERLEHDKRSFQTVAIGLSNPLCKLCKVFLSLITKSHPKLTIVVSTNCHVPSRIVAGWRLPPLTPEDIIRGVQDHVKKSVEENIYRQQQEEHWDSESGAWHLRCSPGMAILAVRRPPGMHTSREQNN